MRQRICLATAALALLCACAPALSFAAQRTLRATPVSSPPVIDGDLSEGAWRQAGVTSGLTNEADGKAARNQTVVYVLSDVEHLYLAFRCAEPEPSLIKAKVDVDNANIWGDDCAEMNFDPTGGMQDIYQFTVNSIGTKELELRGYGHQDLTGVQAAARAGKREWTAELALPFAGVGIKRSPEVEMHWRVNFERLRTIGGEEDDYWQHVQGDWADPAGYGTLVIPGGSLVLEALGLSPLRDGVLGQGSVSLWNRSAVQRQVEVVAEDLTFGTALFRRSASLRPRGKGSVRAAFPVSIGGERELRWTLRDGRTGTRLYCLERPVKVARAIAASVLYHSHELQVDVDISAWGELPAGARVEARLLRAGERLPVCSAPAKIVPADKTAETVIKVGDLPPGEYVLNARATTRGGKGLQGEFTQPVTWPEAPSWAGAPAGLKVLNNFVTELLNVAPTAEGEQGFRFFNPRDGWVFIASTASVAAEGEMRVCLDGGPPESAVMAQSADGPRVGETMRLLPSGEHALHLSCRGRARAERLVVRAVPELIYCGFAGNPQVTAYGPFDWAFFSRYAAPNFNTVIGGMGYDRDYREVWEHRGGKRILNTGVPGFYGEPLVTPEYAAGEWLKPFSPPDDTLGGIIVDEFYDDANPNYPAWTEAVRILRNSPAFQGKTFYPYCGSTSVGARSSAFVRAVTQAGWRFAWERYMSEQPSEYLARRFLRSFLTEEMLQWRQTAPGSENHLIVVFGHWLCAPPETLNVNPSVDYRTWMDMQFRWVANDPAFRGIYGVEEYSTGYADEESVRWAARLIRHYCIEGNTEPLTRDPYVLTHLQNPDFANGLEGWNVEPAEEGSVSTGVMTAEGPMTGYGFLEGRLADRHEGDKFLLMRRSAERPNVVWQTMRDLEPGRLYSLKMYTGDYRDLATEQRHAVSIQLEGVEVLPEKSFQHVFPSCYSHIWGGYSREHPAWMNFHWRVFRATGEQAVIRISDWGSDTDPGGPIGQELMCNFVEVQPYYSE